ncbi:DMT family transporter [Hydrogenoanaerobacterium sp.]|uniref:DMT family transporter n=1 Tax=Hydrogenoanaerobacterium sp. TaxID=2953763 RepID=UPI0028965E88|nr:DMT family transporter [Hydrogenoanaerobacterium sp.]
MMKKSPELKLTIAMLIFGSIGIFVKNITLPSTVIVLWRTIIGSIFLATVLLLRKQPIDRKGIRKNLPQLMVAGTVLGGGWAFLFEAYRHATVSAATLLYYSAPIVVFLLSSILFKEKITCSKAVGIAAAIIGMMIINGTSVNGADSSLGVIYGLTAALLYATLMIVNKFIKGLSGLESTFIQLLISSFVMAVYVIVTTGSILHIPAGNDLLLVVVVGILHTGIACYLYFSSMQELPGQTISVMSYIDPSSALIFSAIFLHERLSALQIVGGLLILGGTAFNQLFNADRAVK